MTVRKLVLLCAGGALWLFVAALPVLADGGIHQMAVNNGTGTPGLTADTCAGCHRAHTATAEGLLNNELPDLCLDCHNGSKATTDVVHGVQYDPNSATGAVLGALRGGGFSYALIDSSNPARVAYWNASRSTTAFIGHVQPLTTGQAVTSTHAGTGTVWGNGAVNSGAGATVDLECAACHNPHGNGQYRILQTKPSLTATAGAFTLTNANGVQVQDTPYTGLRNYTIRPSTNGLVSGVVANTAGDYWRYKYDPTGATAWTDSSLSPDPMNTGWTSKTATYTNSRGVQYSFRYPVNVSEIAQYNADLAAAGKTTDPITGAALPLAVAQSSLSNKGGLMTAWCVQCHTRYDGVSTVTGTAPNQSLSASSLFANSADSLFMYKHGTTRVGCEQCHVQHGSNALMPGSNAGSYEDPSGVASNDSRLLKVNNRGTCQLCHDPTESITADGSSTVGLYIGPLPTPGN
jgi:predicted CXXCH cytochrome family protein